MPMTVREVAERAGHAGDPAFIERLHYWTRKRLLLTTGKRNPGSGQRRMYPDAAVKAALILDAMMDAGVHPDGQRAVMKAVYERLQQKPDLWPSPPTRELYLEIGVLPGGKSGAWFHEGKYEHDSQFERVIVFNITKLFPREFEKTEAGGTNG